MHSWSLRCLPLQVKYLLQGQVQVTSLNRRPCATQLHTLRLLQLKEVPGPLYKISTGQRKDQAGIVPY